MTALVMACGFGIGLGLVLLGYAVLVAPHRTPAPPATRGRGARGSRTLWVRAGIGLALGLVGLLVTGWPVALLVGPLAALGLPLLLAPPGSATAIPRL